MRGALIPMRDLEGAKGRLSDVLSPLERSELALAMFTDVVTACRESALFDIIGVVSGDSDVFWHARELGAKPIAEPKTLSGLNDSLRFGQRYLARRVGVTELLIVPADVPLAQPDDMCAVVEALRRGDSAVVIVRAGDDGTNALAMRPAEAIDMHFGGRSADAHVAAAREAGIEPRELAIERLRFDVDSAADVASLAARELGAATRGWVDARTDVG
jgi:2-phospho-L-lactate guanylyltransferase